MLRPATWRPAAAAKFLAYVAAAVLIMGTLEVTSHTVSNLILQKAPSSSAEHRLFAQIAEDLKPFAAGISLQQVERAFCAGRDEGGFRYKVVLSEPLACVCASQSVSKAGSDISSCHLPAHCIMIGMYLQTASLWWAHVCRRRTERIPVEEQAGTSDMSPAFCLAAAAATDHQSTSLKAGTPNCSCCVWLAA